MVLLEKESGYEAWLRYKLLEEGAYAARVRDWTGVLAASAEGSEVLTAAVQELERGIGGMLGIRPVRATLENGTGRPHVELGAAGQSPLIDSILGDYPKLREDGYVIRAVADREGGHCIALAGSTERGVLYAAFHFLRLLQMETPLDSLEIVEDSANKLRMINQWDNMDGSIERGYAGGSIFYKDGDFAGNRGRITDYARLLASTGINAISINNVNVHQTETLLVTEAYLSRVAETAGLFRPYGIRIFLSVNFAAPIGAGGLSTADPLEENVRRWWADRTADIYRTIPDFGGFLVKADSEFQPGPFTYGRNHVDGANMLAEALQPHGGLLIWRCFVYDCLQDWRDRSTDRAKAAYEHYTPLDGQFHGNVILQIKNGPMDFQVREPVSPLFGGMSGTNLMLEVQITQEYTGHDKDLFYLAPQWKRTIDFDTHAKGPGSTVGNMVSGEAYGRPLGGYAAVSNIGEDCNWTGHPLAQSNLYGFGRLAWNPRLSAEEIAREWTALTFGNGERVMATVSGMLMRSGRIYENYTAPLGVGWMITPALHYGPSVDGYEYSKWGTYHFADRNGLGVDRTAATGTGYTRQYHSPHFEIYESLQNCPDELLLFFHHVPYTHVLQSGQTVIQHIYDTHFAGAEQVEELIAEWNGLQGLIDEDRHARVLDRLRLQTDNAVEWRDTVNTYFYRKSGIPDAQGRTLYG
ncbi:alpha-glucuronidase family glycosyl hydrolase [Paenibacillus sp. S150]|uniref:alpha-glucuronidase family glycosyl hydrolase n=1 Tax=Paenibacillus sp. S150 TaxID=2749826 RepID=UPI001C567600|nr:alpha-glucuronidase family glycosyl hydrolase [Paenibacillus sp. S150]MBW4082222.1 alpha-glucuronidase [Paenibacillus sp. S150]